MSEIKFSCPGCQQNIQAPPEYAGMQIACPKCQTSIVVPQAAPPPGAPGAPKGKLTKAESTVHQPATSPVMQQTIIRRAKKPRTGLYVGLGVAVAVGVAAIVFVPKIMEKYQEHKDAVAAAIAATNAPPPPPPDLNADEIMKKLGATYKAMTSYNVKGESVEHIDMSEINPMMKKPQTVTTKFSILLGRPNLYRIEWDRKAGPRSYKGAAWSAGKGDFVRVANSPMKLKNEEAALTMAGADSGLLGVGLAPLFFDETNSLTATLKDYAKTNNETIDGEKCYVLTGEVASHHVFFWIHKDDSLIVRTKLILGGALSETDLAGMNTAQKMQAQQMAKLKGEITETYQEIAVNKPINPTEFQTSQRLNAAPRQRKPKAPREKPQ